MSRYIDYDAIDYKHYQLHDKSEEFLNGVIYMAERIEDAPSIDIVRCKECKWCDDGNGANRALICTNEYIDIDCHPDFYCGYGERSSE